MDVFWAYAVRRGRPQAACLVFPGLDTLVGLWRERSVVGCSHNLPATAELPSANKPGDRTDRFRPTCHTPPPALLFYVCVEGDSCLETGEFFFALLNVLKEASCDWSIDRMILSAMLTRACACGFIYLFLRVL